MSIHHLRIFLCVTDEQSISKAANRLMISQPSVSQVIAELERQYGVRLFDRIGKRIYITESGSYLARYARQITSMYDEMERGVASSEEKGLMRIGASLTVGSTVLPELIIKMQIWLPSLQIRVVVKNTADIERMLLSNELDLALVEGSIHSEDLRQEAVAEDEVALVCGKTHPLYEKQGMGKDDLNGIAVILREQGSGTRELFERTMIAHDLNWRLIWECADSDGIVAPALQGLGIGVIAKRLVERELNEGTLQCLAVEDITFMRKFSLIAHKNKYFSPPMELFMQIARNHFL